jgi:predicted TIM-barrel fold metal-dependent hydrolase
VDGLFGSYSDLLGSYIEITKGLGETDMHKLFVSNAQRLYRV